MFFVFSKILAFLIQPLNWILGLLAWAVLTKKTTRRLNLLRGCLALVVVLTNPFLANSVFKAWEWDVVPMESISDSCAVGIVLGGFSDFGNYAYNDRLNLNLASNRIIDAVVLYKTGKIKKILVTGGDGKLMGQKYGESERTKPFLVQLGVAESDILIENQSRNTHENALFTQKLLDSLHIEGRKLLITSATHMRRAKACFDKVGLVCDPFPAHFIAERFEWTPSQTISPNLIMLMRWEQVFKEWVGYPVYGLRGYI